jgi:excisionase family DNA binding protein
MPIAHLYTVSEAAAALGVGAPAIRRAVQRGLMTPLRMDGRSYLIPAAEIARDRDEHLRKRGPRGPRTQTTA